MSNAVARNAPARVLTVAGQTAVALAAVLVHQANRQRLGTAALTPFLVPVELSAAESDKPRGSWAQLARTGEFYDPRYGDFEITRKDLASMCDNFTQGRFPVNPTELAFDYNHGTSHPDSTDEGTASGWLKKLELRANGDELWGFVEWTERAASLIDAKEYRFVSPTFSFEYTNSNGGDPIGPTLLAAALTNRPVIHGMQPVSLSMLDPGAVRLADAGAYDQDELAEQLFSFDEIRRRVQGALSARFGVSYPYPSAYDGPIYRGVYLVDLFDGLAVFCDCDGAKYRVAYSLGADGTITFTDEPVEVRISYEPLTETADVDELPAMQTETTMSTMKVKDAKGVEFELSQEALDSILKAHAPKPEQGATIELAALKSTVETQGATILALQSKNEQLELASRTKDANADVDALIKAGKLDPKDRDAWFNLAMNNRDTFVTLSSTLVVRREMNLATGSEADLPEATVAARGQLDLAVNAELKADPKLTREQAYARALDKNPGLYGAVSQ